MTGYSTTPGTSEAAELFVMISYPGADYLVNREEVISSLYHGGEARRGGNSAAAGHGLPPPDDTAHQPGRPPGTAFRGEGRPGQRG